LDATPVPPRKGYKGEAGVALKMTDHLTAPTDLRIDGICSTAPLVASISTM
jgi:hypothetical protein